jgi:uncharacterized protein YndB with AHSA1/START domain
MLAAIVGVLALNRYALLDKFFTILLVIVILGFSLLFFLVDYGKNYLASEKTAKMPLPGDDLLKDNEKVFQFTKEITIDAPPAKVWPYLAQMGQEKAGFYSYELLEKIFTFDIHNTYEIMDKWQDVKPGDWLYYHQMGIGSEIIKVEKGHYFTSLSDSRKQPKKKGTAFALNVLPGGAFAWTWNFIVQELPGSKTLLIQRCHNYFRPANFFTKAFILFFLGVPSLFMTSKQMEVVKACAEGHGPSSSVKI